MSALNVREAKASDDLQIGELLVRSFVETYGQKMPEVVVGERRLQELRNVAQIRSDAQVLVLEKDAEILGVCAVYAPGFALSKVWLPKASELRFMALQPQAQGTGVSKLLIESALECARHQGALRMCLHVRRGAHGVARFYLKQGFTRAPEGDRDQLPEIFLEAYVQEFTK